jgi:hypothetical protein
MGADNRVLVKDAADFIGRGAPRLINRAWKLGAIRFQGLPPGEPEPVEIPPGEGGKIDCVASRVGEGTLLTTYRSVTIAWDDVKRLAQADVERLAKEAQTPPAPPPKQARNRPLIAAEAGPLVKAVALELRRHFPEDRPRGLTRDKLMLYVYAQAGGKIDVFSPATLDRAIALAWPGSKPARVKAAKPPR